MATTGPDDAWAQLGLWLRAVREARGWTREEVAARKAGAKSLIGSTRLGQIERGQHPTKRDSQSGLPERSTLRRIELALWIQPGRIETVLTLAQRGRALPDPITEPLVQPAPVSVQEVPPMTPDQLRAAAADLATAS